MTAANGWNSVELRDNRYNHIVHMVSAANGAEDFYSTEVSTRPGVQGLLHAINSYIWGFARKCDIHWDWFDRQEHACRSEGVELARELDYKSAAAWVGHPYFDVIDNSTDFETKINRMLESVCQKLGIDTGDRLLRTSRKLKFLGKSIVIFDFGSMPSFSKTSVVWRKHNHWHCRQKSANGRANHSECCQIDFSTNRAAVQSTEMP